MSNRNSEVTLNRLKDIEDRTSGLMTRQENRSVKENANLKKSRHKTF